MLGDVFPIGPLMVYPIARRDVVPEFSGILEQADYEQWLFRNPDALARVQRGLIESARGQTIYRGSFAEFCDDPAGSEDDEPAGSQAGGSGGSENDVPGGVQGAGGNSEPEGGHDAAL